MSELTLNYTAVAILALVVILITIGIYNTFYESSNMTIKSFTDFTIPHLKCTLDGAELRVTTGDEKYDLDNDGEPIFCDFCSFSDKPTLPLTGIMLEQWHGSSICDKDNDKMPDACDQEPLNSKINRCDWDPGKTRCTKQSDGFKALAQKGAMQPNGELDCAPYAGIKKGPTIV